MRTNRFLLAALLPTLLLGSAALAVLLVAVHARSTP